MTPEQFDKRASMKFRPVLTLAQIHCVSKLCKDNQGNAEFPEIESVLKVLVPLIAKIEVGAISPAYKLSEIHMLKQADKSDRERYEAGLMDAHEEIMYESKILGM